MADYIDMMLSVVVVVVVVTMPVALDLQLHMDKDKNLGAADHMLRRADSKNPVEAVISDLHKADDSM